MNLLAIDPGPTQSAWLLYDTLTNQPIRWAIDENERLLTRLDNIEPAATAIEMIASYGMPVGAETFETCVWIGRYIERVTGTCSRVFRKQVVLHLCGSPRAKDSNVRQALIDRYGGKDTAIGRKASPGPLHGISKDVWSALAVAVTVADNTLQEAAL